ncbi:MAG: hypothetical protein ACTSU2_15755 [Promethearchaeota archaeon]
MSNNKEPKKVDKPQEEGLGWKERFNKKLKSKEDKKAQTLNAHDMDQETLEKYQNFKFVNVISDGFKIFFKNYHKLIISFVLASLIIAILSTFIFTSITWNYKLQIDAFYQKFGNDPNAWSDEALQVAMSMYNKQILIQGSQVTLNFMPFTLGGIMVSKYIIDKAKNHPNASLKESFTYPFRRSNIRTAIFFLIFITILYTIGMVFMLIPGLIFMMMLGFSFYILSIKDMGLRNLLKSGFFMTDKYRLKIFFLVIVGVSFYLFLNAIISVPLSNIFTRDLYELWLSADSRNYPMLIMYNFIYLASQGIFQPLIFTLLGVQFTEIEVKKDIDWNNLASILSSSSRSDVQYGDHTDIKLENVKIDTGEDGKTKTQKKMEKLFTIKGKRGNVRYYCPYCGQRLYPNVGVEKTIKCNNCHKIAIIP